MQIFERDTPQIGNQEVEAQIKIEVERALQAINNEGTEFVVNDTLWYASNERGKVSAAVVNQADYLSGKFQEALKAKYGWTTEMKIEGQRIDAHKEFRGTFTQYILKPNRFLDFLHEYEDKHGQGSSGPIATGTHLRHCQRQTFVLENELDFLRHYFEQAPAQRPLRVGLEFETGNIASSFRALKKLDFLYLSNQIDIGVFITSINKEDAATRIWPSSNRNGSFAELEGRQYKTGLLVPLWEFGFAPDRFDKSAQYLSATKKPKSYGGYQMTDLRETTRIGSLDYAKYRTPNGETRLRLADLFAAPPQVEGSTESGGDEPEEI